MVGGLALGAPAERWLAIKRSYATCFDDANEITQRLGFMGLSSPRIAGRAARHCLQLMTTAACIAAGARSPTASIIAKRDRALQRTPIPSDCSRSPNRQQRT